MYLSRYIYKYMFINKYVPLIPKLVAWQHSKPQMCHGCLTTKMSLPAPWLDISLTTFISEYVCVYLCDFQSDCIKKKYWLA